MAPVYVKAHVYVKANGSVRIVLVAPLEPSLVEIAIILLPPNYLMAMPASIVTFYSVEYL
jgi:hypothetical protein